MFYFSEPESAIRSGLALIEQAEKAISVPARIGIAGPVIVQEGDYYGRTVNVAARIADYAGPHEVLVSEAAVKLGHGRGAFELVGDVPLKACRRPWLQGEAGGDGMSDDARPAGATPPAREGPRRRPLPRAARRLRPGTGGAPLAGALQPRVPQGLRRVAAPVPPHQAPGACRGAASPHRPGSDICFAVGLRSVGSFTTSFRRAYGVSPTEYRAAHPPALTRVRIPTCIAQAYARPQSSTFREDSPARATNVVLDLETQGEKRC